MIREFTDGIRDPQLPPVTGDKAHEIAPPNEDPNAVNTFDVFARGDTSIAIIANPRIAIITDTMAVTVFSLMAAPPG
jgi:hypothetical protein